MSKWLQTLLAGLLTLLLATPAAYAVQRGPLYLEPPDGAIIAASPLG